MRTASWIMSLMAATSIAASVVSAETQEANERREVLDQNMFKGRLVGIVFANSLEPFDGPTHILLQFIIEEPYAVLGGELKHGRVTTVRTAWEADLGLIREDNYVEAVDGMFNAPIGLGQSCLVHSHWPGARGYELLNIEPATEESETRFLEQHREYLLKFQRRQNATEIRARIVKLRTVLNEMKRMERMNEELEAAGGTVSPEVVAHVLELEAGLAKSCAETREMIASKQESIRAKFEQEIRQDARANMEGMIADLDEIFAEVDELCGSGSN